MYQTSHYGAHNAKSLAKGQPQAAVFLCTTLASDLSPHYKLGTEVRVEGGE